MASKPVSVLETAIPALYELGMELTTAAEVVVINEEPTKKRSKIRLIAILVALNLSMFVSALDQTIIATAIPTIVSDLNNANGYAWIGGAYVLASAATSPIWMKLSDIWGRKPIIMTAQALFFGSSLITATSKNMTMLIAGRALQGVASGGIGQLAFIVISDIFSLRQRSLIMGLSASMWAIAGGTGPVLGGAFSQTIGWRWCFWINLPVSGFAFLLILVFLNVHNPKTKIRDGIKAVDWFGSVSILGLMLMLLLGLQFGGAVFPWSSPKVICLIVFGCLMSIIFIFSEKKAKFPLIPLEIFKESSNVACIALGFFHGFISVAVEYYPPLYFQAVKGALPLHSGLLVLPILLTESAMAIFAGVFIHRTGRYLTLIRVGPVLMTAGVGLYILFSRTSSLGQIIGVQILTGIGCGLLFEPPMLALQAWVPQDKVATASSTYGLLRSISYVMSIVIGGVIFQNSMDSEVSKLMASPLSLPSNITDMLSHGQAAANVMTVNLIQDAAQKMAVQEAFAWSLRNMWIFMVCVSSLCIVATMFIKRKVLSTEHVETKTGIAAEKA